MSIRTDIAGAPTSGRDLVEVRSPYDGSLVGEVVVPTDAAVEAALQAAAAAAPVLAAMPAWERSERLLAASARIGERIDALARTISLEAGKPIREARGEATRAMYVFRWAGEQAKRIEGRWIPFDTEPGLGERGGLLRRFPIGPVLAIAPFNFPLNLVAHKVAPALAVGNPVLVKPATQTPLSALALAEVLAEDDWPDGALTVLAVPGERASQIASDPRVRGITFTGSDAVGWRLKAANAHKKVTLELGGNAAVLVEPDADIELAADRLTFGGYAYAGQVCISTQRILVAEAAADHFLDAFLPRVARLRTGDPLDERTELPPMITPGEAERVAGWVDEARAGGAAVLAGGGCDGSLHAATVLDGVPHEARCWQDEVFGPVTCIDRYEGLEQGIRLANATRYGLQSAIFTRDLDAAMRAHASIDAGSIIVNEAPFFRAVQQPYGGARDSGYGREGVGFAMEEMSEPRLLVMPVPGAS
ncbi:MAG TPA: aldehyde dehydrogenase family protein [Solirubrobacteraceae bacterium]|nr:aldehyde dehydrogenase family protein [Solirubrobacteraceae bacterium]